VDDLKASSNDKKEADDVIAYYKQLTSIDEIKKSQN